MGIFTRLFGASVPEQARPVVCSGCYEIASGDNAHVIPWWNTSGEDFFTTYRCGKCWLTSLDETEAKVRSLDESARGKFCEFLERHHDSDLRERVQKAALGDARVILGDYLQRIRSGKVRLNP